MKKNLMYIMMILVFLLTACTGKEIPGDADGEKATDKQSEEAVDTPNVEGEEDEEDEEDVSETGEFGETIEEAASPMYEMDADWGFSPIGDADPKVVLLTIDDAPDKHALDMAKTLHELDAPAIFYVNGHFIETEEQKEVLKEIHDMGFPIGNHTKTHANLQEISEEEQREEIVSVSDAIEEAIGERPKFFRAPFGVNSDYSRALVDEEGMLLMNWSYGYDWEKQYMEPTALADIMVNTEFLKDGANLLMHDREWTAAALPDIVEGLRDKGYDFIDPLTIKGIE